MAKSKNEAPKGADTIVEPRNETKVEIAAEPEVTAATVKTAEEGIVELKKKLDEERANRERAERERNEAIQRAYQAKNETEDTNLRLIESAIGQVTENSRSLKRDLAAAYGAQDFDRAAEIQEAIARNEAQKLQLENGKQSLKERPKEQAKPLDPVEALASQLSPRSAAWVRAHPEYATDHRLMQKMIAAHNLAVADGLRADTDDYFASVEDTLKIGRRAPMVSAEDEDDPLSSASTPTQHRQSPSAIPVSRDVTPSGQRQRVVRLTKDEAEMASMMKMTEKEYWEQKQALLAEGRYGTTH